jgi:alpha-ketoglutarate-dependent taurine dioxygenase
MTSPSHIISSALEGGTVPLIVTPRRPMVLLDFADEYAQWLESVLAEHGAVLFRGFGVSGESMLATLFERLWAPPLSYVYRSTPRTDLGDGIYTATEYPASQEIPMHNENAYQRTWPMRLGFHSVLPAASGGQTPLADVVRITGRIGADLVSEFRERQVSYIRNYSDFIDLPWQTVFQTRYREEVETFCSDHEIGFEWTNDGLRTRQICQGTAVHPATGEQLWFNQAHLFHISSLGTEMASSMIELFGVDGLPRNAYFGDGKPIPESAIAHINKAFEQEKIVFDWQNDDILILDNMRIAHGRKPFTGSRRVLVSMGVPFSPTSTCSDAKRARQAVPCGTSV